MKIVDCFKPQFYLYLGRISFEKGADRFFELAAKYPKRNFLMCGEGPMYQELFEVFLPNFIMTGYVKDEKQWLFENAEAIIIPSRVPETCSLVITESHPYNTPIVYPRGGGAEEYFHILGRKGCPIDEFCGQAF